MFRSLAIVIVLAAFNIAATAEEAADAPANNYKIQLSGWSYGRERKTITGSNRVTATLTMKKSRWRDSSWTNG